MQPPSNSSGPQFERKQYPFDQIGVDLNAPVDRAKDGLVVVMENWRPEIDGALTIRPGQGNGLVIVGGQSPIHSLIRMQDTSSGALVEAIFAGVGTHIGQSDVALTIPADLGAGWANEPKSMFVHQPTESVKPYCYICDSVKSAKFDVVGNAKQVGLARPQFAPLTVMDQPRAKFIDHMDTAANWLVGGTAAALAQVLRADPATRSIAAIVYDNPFIATGWACVFPSSMVDIGAGMELGVVTAPAETFIVQSVSQGSAQTTIAASKFDATTGVLWIHLTSPIAQLDVDSMVLLDSAGAHGGPEYVRVLAVERTKVGFTSFSCIPLSGAYTAGDTAQAVPSFRAFFLSMHSAGNTLTATALQFTVAAGIGSITRNVGASTPIDCSNIATGIPTNPDDLVHLSLYVDKPELVTEVKVFFDVDSATTNVFSAADHTKNYLFHSIRQNDLVPVTKGQQTALDNAATQYQRGILDQVLAEGLSTGDGLKAAHNSPRSTPTLLPREAPGSGWALLIPATAPASPVPGRVRTPRYSSG